MTDPKLSFQEQLLLLCLNDDSGIFEGPYISYGLNAAALAELLLENRITLNGEFITFNDETPLDDSVLDNAIERVRTTTRRYSLAWWIRCLYLDIGIVKDELVVRLVQRGILRSDDGHFMYVLRRNVYPTLNPFPEQRLRDEMREAALGTGAAEAHTAILVALLQAGQSLDLVLNREERTRHKERIQELCASNPIARAIGEAMTQVIAEDEGFHRHAVVTERHPLMAEAVIAKPADAVETA